MKLQWLLVILLNLALAPTPTPTPRPTPAPMAIKDGDWIEVPSPGVEAWTCAASASSCSLVYFLQGGLMVQVDAIVRGRSVNRSLVWFRVLVDGGVPVYVAAGSLQKPDDATPAPTVTTTPVMRSITRPACNGATRCSEMVSCDQARACLAEGNARLDTDGDGVPCEDVCGG